jgi:hypothetical protein
MHQPNLNEIQENLSFSYLHAITSKAGGICTATARGEDNRGLDARLIFTANGIYRQVEIGVQLKSTRTCLTIVDSKISYAIHADQYKKYTQKSTTQLLFVLFCLPENPNEWLNLTENELILKKCAYWTGLKNAPSCTGDSITIHIPQRNLLSAEQLQSIVNRISNGEELVYES